LRTFAGFDFATSFCVSPSVVIVALFSDLVRSWHAAAVRTIIQHYKLRRTN